MCVSVSVREEQICGVMELFALTRTVVVICNLMNTVRKKTWREMLCCGPLMLVDWCLPSGSRPIYVHGIPVHLRSIPTLARSLQLGVIFCLFVLQICRMRGDYLSWAVPNQMYRKITMDTDFNAWPKLQRGTKNLKQNIWPKNSIPGLNQGAWLAK